MNLYELTGQYLELQKMAEDGELDQDVLSDTLEAMDGDIEEKANSYGKVIRNLEESAKSLDAEIERLTQRKKMFTGNAQTLKKNLEKTMIVLDKRKIKTDLFSFNIQKNAPSVQVNDESKVPAEFFVPQEPKLDKKALLAFLKEADPVEWAEIKQTESIRMR